MLGKNDVMVVIPVYRNPVDYEMISLQQCLRMLGNYPMTLVAPASMDVSIYLSLHPFFVERFGYKTLEAKLVLIYCHKSWELKALNEEWIA